MPERKGFEAEPVKYLADEFYEGDLGALAKRTGYTKQQIDLWVKGKRKPYKATLRWLLSSTIAPEFKVVAEFAPVEIDSDADIRRTKWVRAPYFFQIKGGVVN